MFAPARLPGCDDRAAPGMDTTTAAVTDALADAVVGASCNVVQIPGGSESAVMQSGRKGGSGKLARKYRRAPACYADARRSACRSTVTNAPEKRRSAPRGTARAPVSRGPTRSGVIKTPLTTPARHSTVDTSFRGPCR